MQHALHILDAPEINTLPNKSVVYVHSPTVSYSYANGSNPIPQSSALESGA